MNKMTNCKACGKEIAKGAKICPSCGKEQRNFFMRHKIISIILGFMIIGGISAIADGGNKTQKPVSGTSTNIGTEPKKEINKPKYEILEHKAVDDGGMKYIVGKIKNNTGKQVGYTQVEINLYDANGQQSGSTMTNINNLEIDGVWNFKALVTEENFKTYKIMNITGF